MGRYDQYTGGVAPDETVAEPTPEQALIGRYSLDAMFSPSHQTKTLPVASEPQPLNKYQQAAIADREALAKAGYGFGGEGYSGRLAQGAGLGWADEINAAFGTPIYMARHGTLNPVEGYRYGKAAQDLTAQKIRESTAGPLGTALEIGGGLGTAGGVLAGTRAATRTIPGTSVAIPPVVVNMAKGATIGAVGGAGEAPTVEDVPKFAGMGSVFGAGIAGAAPLVTGAVRYGARAAQMPRFRDPERIATEQITDVARAAGVDPVMLVQRMNEAHAAGQPYTVADALGKEGVRKLTAMAKVPGAQRDEIYNVLTARDLNMPIRTGAEVGTQLGAPHTAEAAAEQLRQQASTQAAPLYRQSERVPTWNSRIEPFLADPIAQAGLRSGVEIQRLRSVGSGQPFNPTDAMITGFDASGAPIISGVPNMQTLHTLKVGLDHMIEGAVNPATGRPDAYGHALIGFRNRLLGEIDRANPTYAQARQVYGGPMQVRDAIAEGQQMARTGRHEDTVGAFRARPATEQQGVRIGYADAVRGPLEQTGNFPTILREKSVKGVNELNALARDPVALRNYLNREEAMLRTSKNALGGSSTIENAADVAAGPGGAEALGFITNALQGRWGAAAKQGLEAAARVARGENEAQRVAITRQLLANDPAAVGALANRIVAQQQKIQSRPGFSHPHRFRRIP
jgi:hypothetical protein